MINVEYEEKEFKVSFKFRTGEHWYYLYKTLSEKDLMNIEQYFLDNLDSDEIEVVILGIEC